MKISSGKVRKFRVANAKNKTFAEMPPAETLNSRICSQSLPCLPCKKFFVL
jgi:hypothetical protein